MKIVEERIRLWATIRKRRTWLVLLWERLRIYVQILSSLLLTLAVVLPSTTIWWVVSASPTASAKHTQAPAVNALFWISASDLWIYGGVFGLAGAFLLFTLHHTDGLFL